MAKKEPYQGPAEELATYLDVIAGVDGPERKGAKNPYTSRGGWMQSFLDQDGTFCLRVSKEDKAHVIEELGGSAVMQYGKNMPDFVALAAEDFDGVEVAVEWMQRSWDFVGTLTPK